MSAAEVINYKNAKSAIQIDKEIETILSISTNDRILEDQSDEQANEKAVNSRAANRKFVAESNQYSAPVDSTPTVPANTKQTSVDKLFNYLNLLMLFQVKTSKDQSTLTKMNESLSDSNITLVKAYAAQATSALNTYIDKINDEKAAAAKKSMWSILAGVATILLGCLTGDPVAFVMGAIQLAMQIPVDRDGDTLSSMMDKSLSTLSPALQVIIPLVIAIAETVALCGIQAALSKVGSVAAQTADVAENTAVTVGKEVGSDAAKSSAEVEMTSMATVAGKTILEEVSETEETVVTQGSKLVLKDATKKMVEGSLQKLIELANTLKLPQIVSFLRAIKLPEFLMMLSTGSFWPTVCKQIAEQCTSDPDEQDKLTMYLTEGFMIGTTMGGSLLAAGASNGLTNLLKRFEGDQNFMLFKLGVKATEAGCGVTSAAYSLEMRGIQLDEQNVLNVQADARYVSTLAQGLSDEMSATNSRVVNSFNQLYEDCATISNNSQKFIDAYDPQQLMG